MPLVDPLGPDDVDDAAIRDVMEADVEKHGRIGLMKRMLAYDPATFDCRGDYFKGLRERGSVSRQLQELAHVTVSYRNESRYPAASHAQKYVESMGHPMAHVEAIAAGHYEPFDDVQAAVVRFAEQVAEDPKGVTAADLDALRAAGLDDGQVVGLLNWISHVVDANTFADAIGLEPTDHSEALADYYIE